MTVGLANEGEGFESRQDDLILSFQGLRQAVLESVPERMDVLVGVGQVVVLCDVQVVEVVGLEHRGSLSVVVLLGAPLKFPVGLDDRRMSLILAKEHQVTALDSIEGLAHLMIDHYFALYSIAIRDIQLYQPDIGIESQDDFVRLVEVQIHVDDIAKLPGQANVCGCETGNFHNRFGVLVQTVVGKPLGELSCDELGVTKGFQVDNCGSLWQLVVLVVDLVQQVGSLFVVDDQQATVAQLVHLKLVETLQVLEVVAAFDPEAREVFLNDEDDIGSEEYHNIVGEHQQVTVLVGDCRTQFLND